MRRNLVGFLVMPVVIVGALIAFASSGAEAKRSLHDHRTGQLPRVIHAGVLLEGSSHASESVVGPGAIFDAMLRSRAAGDTIIYRVCKDLTICYIDVPDLPTSIVVPPPTLPPPALEPSTVAIPPRVAAAGPSLLWGGLGLPFALLGFFLPSDGPGEGAGGGGEPPPGPPPTEPPPGPPPPPEDCVCPVPVRR